MDSFNELYLYILFKNKVYHKHAQFSSVLMNNIVITLIFISPVYSILSHEIGNESNGFHIRCTCKKPMSCDHGLRQKKKQHKKQKSLYFAH